MKFYNDLSPILKMGACHTIQDGGINVGRVYSLIIFEGSVFASLCFPKKVFGPFLAEMYTPINTPESIDSTELSLWPHKWLFLTKILIFKSLPPFLEKSLCAPVDGPGLDPQ